MIRASLILSLNVIFLFFCTASYAITQAETANLIERLIQAESSGNPNAVGTDHDSRGLMQLVKGTWEMHTDEPFSKAFDSDLNRQIGTAEVHRIISVYRSRGIEPPIAYVAWTYNTGSFIKHHLPKFDRTGNPHPWTWNHPNKIYRTIYREYLS